MRVAEPDDVAPGLFPRQDPRCIELDARAVAGHRPPAPGTTQWESVGPTNIGGRITCLVCDPANPDRIWAGAAGGGVWQSADAGRTWKGLWHSQAVLNVGALAIHPTNPKILYCGTGEANLSADSYAGVGLYRTTNGGKSWTLFASCAKTTIPSRIGVIAIDPHDPSHIRIGGIGFGKVSPQENGFGGMYTSRDAGKTWVRETFISAQNYWCHSIVFDPVQPQRIFATITAQGVSNGVWRSLDGGGTWMHLTNGLPAPAKCDRATLAMAPSDSNIIYLQVAGSKDTVLGIFRTSDGGNNWKSIGGSHFDDEGQMTYGNSIVVHPTNPNQVICGGVDLHRTTNGGNTWKQITHWDSTRGDAELEDARALIRRTMTNLRHALAEKRLADALMAGRALQILAREFRRAVVPTGAVLLQALHHDPVEVAADCPE